MSQEDSLGKEFNLKKINDPRNVADAWQQRVPYLNPITASSSFGDKYLNFRAALHAHFIVQTRGELGQINTCDLCAVFKRSPDIVGVNLNGITIVECVTEIDCPKKLADDDQQAVFVDDVEFRNYQEGALGRLFPCNVRSLVWLQALNSCECFRQNQRLDIFLGPPEVRLADTDREKGFVAARNIIPVEDRQLTDQVIQSGTKIVDNIANNKGPIGIVWRYFPVPEDHTPPLRLVIDDEKVIFVFRCSPSVDCSLKLKEVIVRSSVPEQDEEEDELLRSSMQDMALMDLEEESY